VSRATAYRLLRRYRQEGWEGLRDRPSIAKHCPHRLSAEAEAQIVAVRRQTGWGPQAIASALGRSPSTVWRVLRRYGLSRAERQPRPPANRYEYAAAGELVHLDTKKLGRFWQVGKRILQDGVQRSREPAGSTPMSPWMTIPAGAWSSCDRVKTPRAAPRFWPR
jgi:transposase